MDLFWTVFTDGLGGMLLIFGGAETYALVRGKEPYTQWIRARLGIEPARPRRVWAAPLFAVVLAGFVIWFIPHIEHGIWPR